MCDDPERLQLLLENGADITCRVNGLSLLETAIQYKSSLAITFILKYATKPEEMAFRKGCALLVDDMLERSWDWNVKIGENEDTILGAAVREGYMKIVDFVGEMVVPG